MYNSSDFASVTLTWSDPVGRVDSYNIIKMSVGSSLSEQYSVAMPSLKLNQIPYNENVTVGISAVNCVAQSEEVNISFIISKQFFHAHIWIHTSKYNFTDYFYFCIGACNVFITLPFSGLVYNISSSFNEIVPSGEQICFGCEQGFYPREPIVTTCQENGLWYPDPSELICQSKRFVSYYSGCADVDEMLFFPPMT